MTNLAGCDAPFPAGDNSNAVTATGKVGSEPKVEFPTPLVAKSGQVTVIDQGDGDVVYPTNTVEVLISQYDPKTGEATRSTGYEADSALRGVAGSNIYLKFDPVRDRRRRGSPARHRGDRVRRPDPGCHRPGRRTRRPLDETQVFVIDVLDTYLGKANGWDQFLRLACRASCWHRMASPASSPRMRMRRRISRIAELKARHRRHRSGRTTR